MRIAVIADIHGNAPALEAVLADISERSAERIVNLGDHFSGPLNPGTTLSLLGDCGAVSIAGNHDREVIATDPDAMEAIDRHAFDAIGPTGRAWIAGLAGTARISAANDTLFFCHGTPTDDSTHWLFEKGAGKRFFPVPADRLAREAPAYAAVSGCGHSHVQRVVHLADGRIVFNPGSVGRPAFAMSDPHDAARRSPAAQYALLEKTGGRWSVTPRQVAYDHEEAAAMALAFGAKGWAGNLIEGWAR